jgi:glycosyltransferase involved in cell wall biosynthesis
LKTLGASAAEPSGADLRLAAAAIASNRPPLAPRQLLVDVSAMVKVDLGTGVQRVVRHVLMEWLKEPPEGFRVEPVFSPGRAQPYRYARRFAANLAGVPHLRLEDSVVQAARGDMFLGLDLAASLTHENEPVLHELRDRGVRIFFTVYDVLPVLMPAMFPEGTELYFRNYLRTISSVSEGIACISSAVAGELSEWIASEPSERRTRLRIGHFHLGADLAAPPESSRLTFAARRALPHIERRPSLLMVGTIEPRKGHAQALAAAQLLWARGVDFNLVIVGKAGWMVDEVVRAMRASPEFGRRLFWFGHAPDALLLQLYARCSALLAASRGEGFGLPMIEAAQQGLPLIARDLPVFREVAGDHAFYFSGDDASALAEALQRWFALHAAGQHPAPQGLSWLSWSQSAKELAAFMLTGGEQPTSRAPPPQLPDSGANP